MYVIMYLGNGPAIFFMESLSSLYFFLFSLPFFMELNEVPIMTFLSIFRIGIPAIFMCPGLSTLMGSGLIFGTGIVYGMMALGKK